ncbi:MAG: sensor histidine kinase [Lachnospiraceae bacterium]|nr:sensor histidine kinase [Lachnospiraceae bacterium]
MSLVQIVGANYYSVTVNVIFVLWMSDILLGRIPRLRIKHVIKYLLCGMFVVFVISIVGAVCYRTGVWRWKYGIGVLMWEYFLLACEVVFLQFLYQKSLRDCCLGAMMVEILYSYGELLSQIYIYDKLFHLDIPSERQSYLFWMLVISPACLLLCGLVIDKSGMGKVYRQWIEQEKRDKGILIVLGLYPVFYFLLKQIAESKEPNRGALLLPLAMLLFIHMIFVYVGRDRQQKQYIAAQQANLRQQTIYIEKMEQIQFEIRRFRHDFKNMTAGMYIQARDGDLDAVQSFIQEMTEDFDRQVGDQVRLLNQLANVHMVEVKGLLLEKLALMQKEKIRCELEVLRPFKGTRMRSTDLCRCLGILMDNAVDEVRGKEDAQIHLMISSQNDCTTFRIKNTLYGMIDFQCLGTTGYTTKGEGHGIGLESYQKIIGKYDFVFPFTAIQEGCFVQELKIQEI